LGSNSSILIGREGQTLDAVQHWVSRAVARETYGSPRLFVDVEQYRHRKLAKLERMARREARDVVETGKAVRLDPMGPVERKHIHNLLKDVPGVTTFSIGREGERRLVIAPAGSERGEERLEDEEELGELRGDEPIAPNKRGPTKPSDDLLKTGSTLSSLRVIATPPSYVEEDEDLDEDLLETDPDEEEENR
jgi:hypothetical protein